MAFEPAELRPCVGVFWPVPTRPSCGEDVRLAGTIMGESRSDGLIFHRVWWDNISRPMWDVDDVYIYEPSPPFLSLPITSSSQEKRWLNPSRNPAISIILTSTVDSKVMLPISASSLATLLVNGFHLWKLVSFSTSRTLIGSMFVIFSHEKGEVVVKLFDLERGFRVEQQVAFGSSEPKTSSLEWRLNLRNLCL